MGLNNNYSYQHLWTRFVTSSRWLSGVSSGIVIERYIKGSGSNSGRKVRKNVDRGVAVMVLGVWMDNRKRRER